MSGGERARVLLARMLVTGAPLLVADEPAAGLDPDAAFRVMEILRARAQGGAAVAATLHDLTLAARTCDRLAVLQCGRLVALGPPQAALSGEVLASAFGLEGQLIEFSGWAGGGGAASNREVRPRRRTADRRAGLVGIGSAMQVVGQGDGRRAVIEAGAIDLHRLQHAHHVVARLGKRDALDEIERIGGAAARVATPGHPGVGPSGPGVVGGGGHDVGAAELIDQLAEIGRAQGHVVVGIVEVVPRMGGADLAGDIGGGGGHELHHAPCPGAGARVRIEAALLAGDSQDEGRLGGANCERRRAHGIAALRQDVAVLGGVAHHPHGELLIAPAAGEIHQQGIVGGAGEGLGHVGGEGVDGILGPDAVEKPQGLDCVAGLEGAAIGGGDPGVFAQGQIGQPGLHRRQLAIEGGVEVRRLAVEDLCGHRIVHGLRRAAPPVEGAALGQGRLADGLQAGEPAIGAVGIVEAGKGQPAGIEGRLAGPRALRQAGVAGRHIGAGGVAGLQGIGDERPVLPQLFGRRLAGQLGRKILHEGAGHGRLVVFAQPERLLVDQAGVLLQGRGQGGDEAGEIGIAPACGHPGIGQSLLLRRKARQQILDRRRRRAV